MKYNEQHANQKSIDMAMAVIHDLEEQLAEAKRDIEAATQVNEEMARTIEQKKQEKRAIARKLSKALAREQEKNKNLEIDYAMTEEDRRLKTRKLHEAKNQAVLATAEVEFLKKHLLEKLSSEEKEELATLWKKEKPEEYGFIDIFINTRRISQMERTNYEN